jgi:uncharacterized protein YcgI (DUF1989 family)
LLAAPLAMDETIALDLNGKMVLRLRLVRQAMVAARTGWADRLSAGQQDGHSSCTENFLEVMSPFLGRVRFVPQPVNLFMNVAVLLDGRVETGDNPSKPCDCVVFKAWIDTVVALSACPQEFNPVAGWYPTDLHVGIYEAA